MATETTAKLEVFVTGQLSVGFSVVGEFMTEEELRAFLRQADIPSRIAKAIRYVFEHSAEATQRMDEMGWVDDNRPVHIGEVLSSSPQVTDMRVYPYSR